MKTKKSYLMYGLLILSIIISSCNSDDDNITTPPEEEVNECIDYNPTSASNIINADWAAPNDIDRYVNEIVIPEDLGGGYVRVYLSQSDPDLRPALIVSTDLDEAGAIISGSSANTNNELVREAYFSVYPGMSYSIEVTDFFGANPNNYPVNYTLEWEFVSKVDCWEINDNQSQAKKMLLGETIEAYAIAGYRDDFLATGESQTYDWYKVEMDEAGKLEAEVLTMPNDMRILMTLYKADGSTIPTDFLWLTEETPNNVGRLSKITSSSSLNPGTYYIELHSDNVIRKAENDLQPLPNHFNTKYRIRTKKI